MPIYLNKEVSDDYLQGLIAAYRNGYDGIAGDGASNDDDQPIIDRLAQEQVVLSEGAQKLGTEDAQKVESEG